MVKIYIYYIAKNELDLSQRQESCMLYQYFETRIGIGIENKAGWEIGVERDVAFGAGLRGDPSAEEKRERKASGH